jgi:hypothetical protein
MATKYPDGIDNTTSLPYITNGTSPMVAEDINRLRDAVVAVETELGADPSGTFTSVAARVAANEQAISEYARSEFLVLSHDGYVSRERVFMPSTNFAATDGGPGFNYELDLAANVGIGTATPASDYSLTLDGNGTTRIGGVTLRNAGTDTFYVGSATASDSANIRLMNPNAGYVAVGTDGTERLRITSAGDVGLGTTSPAGRLHVSGGDLLVDTGDVGIGTATPAGRLHVSGGDLLVDTGDVGIGTLAPSELLHVSGGNLLLESSAGAGVPYAIMKGTQGGVQLSSNNNIGKMDILDSTGAVVISLLNDGDNRLVGANNANFSFYTNNTEKMRLSATGELLINTVTNPDSAQMHVSGGGITHSSSQFNARPGSGVNYEWVNRDGAGHTWYVNSAATQAMTIAGTGNVGIGTVSPAAQLSIGSSSQFRVDSSGDIVRINDVPYAFPAVQGVASSALRNDGSGDLSWSLVQDTEIVGGLQTVADITARDAIAAAQRKEGMVVYSQADDRHFVLEGGVTNSDWKELGDDNRLVGGLQTVASTAARDAIPAARRKEGMIVYSQADDRHFVLEGGLTNSNWKELGDDGRLVGGMRVVSSLSTIPLANQKVDMLVMLSTTNTVYRLNATSAPPIPAANWVKLFTANGGTDTIAALALDELSVSGIVLRQIEAVHARGLKGRQSSVDYGSSRVHWGFELMPAIVSLLPDFAPAATLKPGYGVSADGLNVNLSLDVTADITDPANYLPSSSPPVSYPASIYAFVDYDQQLRFSTTPPDQFGRPATAEAGYAIGEYVYVGMMRPIAAVGGDFDTVWGAFSVSHLGNGVRKLYFGDIGDLAAPNVVPMFESDTNTMVPTSTQTTNLLDGVTATVFPTCSEVEAVLFGQASPSITTGEYLGYVRGHGVWLSCSAYRTASVRSIWEQTIVVTLATSESQLTLDNAVPANPGNYTFLFLSWVRAAIENVNQPVPLKNP